MSFSVELSKNKHLFNGPLSGTMSQVSLCQKGKTNLDFTEARDSETSSEKQLLRFWNDHNLVSHLGALGQNSITLSLTVVTALRNRSF